MLFKDYTYSVLIVSSSEKFNDAILPLLPENEFGPIARVTNVGEARRTIANRGFDIVLINTPLTDSFGTKLALDIAADSPSGVLLFVKADLYEEITDKVIDYGIFTLSKPTSSVVIHQILKNMYAMQERLKRIERKNATLEEKMEEIRIVNHAKWILIQNMKLTEDDAHRLIEKQAMDTRRSKREIAEGILKTYQS
ncbi:MAG: ANTAR domain-containing protein [Clostridiales bacterium]|nr:ANTAR domain-containing protein [Clostridiales bacterium]